jgi:hypothetical protein
MSKVLEFVASRGDLNDPLLEQVQEMAANIRQLSETITALRAKLEENDDPKPIE